MTQLLALKDANVVQGLKATLKQACIVMELEKGATANPTYTFTSLPLRAQLVPFAGMVVEEFRGDRSL